MWSEMKEPEKKLSAFHDPIYRVTSCTERSPKRLSMNTQFTFRGFLLIFYFWRRKKNVKVEVKMMIEIYQKSEIYVLFRDAELEWDRETTLSRVAFSFLGRYHCQYGNSRNYFGPRRKERKLFPRNSNHFRKNYKRWRQNKKQIML